MRNEDPQTPEEIRDLISRYKHGAREHNDLALSHCHSDRFWRANWNEARRLEREVEKLEARLA